MQEKKEKRKRPQDIEESEEEEEADKGPRLFSAGILLPLFPSLSLSLSPNGLLTSSSAATR